VLTTFGVAWLAVAGYIQFHKFSFGVYVPKSVPRWVLEGLLWTVIAVIYVGWIVPLGIGIRSLRH
jgi:hypothetical protein